MTDEPLKTPPRPVRDPSGTIRRIIAAAREEFGANGFDGTKVEHIARRASVSKQLVYLYFKSKDELYGEMLKAISRQSAEELLEIDLDAMEPEAAIRTYIGTVYDRYQADPVVALVTIDQTLHSGAQVRPSPEIRRLREAMWQKLEDTLARGRASQVFAPDVNAENLEFMTTIIVSGCVSSRGMFSRLRGKQGAQDDDPAFWRDYAVSFILRALRA